MGVIKMGVSKDDYGKKFYSIYKALYSETRSTQALDFLENEYTLMMHLFGLQENPSLNGLVMSFQMKGQPFRMDVSDNFKNFLFSSFKRLITKAYIGVSTESKIKADYDNEIKQLKASLDSVRKERDRYKGMVDGGKKDMVSRSDYEALLDEKNTLQEQYNSLDTKYKSLQLDMAELEKSLSIEEDEENEPNGLFVWPPDATVVTTAKAVPMESISLVKESDPAPDTAQLLNDYKGKYDRLLKQALSVQESYKKYKKSYDELVPKYSKLKQDYSTLQGEKSEVDKKIKEYQAYEKAVLPELRKSLYQKKRQGKSISLSKKDIELVVKSYLYGESIYGISKKSLLDYSTVYNIVHCGFTGLPTLKKVLGVLHKVNGHWTEDRKDLLELLISQYEAEVDACEYRSKQLKKQIDKMVNSLEIYLQALKGSYIEYEYEEITEGTKKPKIIGAKFCIGEKPASEVFIEDGVSGEIIDADSLVE